MGERTKLGLWVCLPLLAWTAALAMPASDCDGNANAFSAGRDLTIGGGAVVALGLATVASAPRDRIEVIPVVGLLLTGLALVVLLVAWAAGVRVNRVGLLLPLYLFGAALFAYPIVGLLGLLSSSGIGC